MLPPWCMDVGCCCCCWALPRASSALRGGDGAGSVAAPPAAPAPPSHTPAPPSSHPLQLSPASLLPAPLALQQRLPPPSCNTPPPAAACLLLPAPACLLSPIGASPLLLGACPTPSSMEEERYMRYELEPPMVATSACDYNLHVSSLHNAQSTHVIAPCMQTRPCHAYRRRLQCPASAQVQTNSRREFVMGYTSWLKSNETLRKDEVLTHACCARCEP